MSQTIKLYSQDYSTVLLETEDRATAHQFLRDSGEDSMPIVIDFGNGWKSRWSGRVKLAANGSISYVGGSEYLKYMIHPPNPFVS